MRDSCEAFRTWRCDEGPFIPAGTIENSPPLQRWVAAAKQLASPAGAKEPAALPGTAWTGGYSAVPGGTPGISPGRTLPPLKRWAIFRRPSGTGKSFESHLGHIPAIWLRACSDT